MGKVTKPSAIKAKNKELKLRGIPRRPLSSYNMFFSIQRKKILDDQKLKAQEKNDGRANVGFANLAFIVSEQWKNVDPTLKAELEVKAHQDRIRYKHEMREWELKQKMEADIEEIKADLETTETEMKTKSETTHALAKLEVIKKELEQIKQMSNKTNPEKNDEKKETVTDAESKKDTDTEMAVADIDNASPAADINEAIAFLKETRASRGHSIATASYTPVHTRNVFGASAMPASHVPPSLIVMDLGAVTPTPIQTRSPFHHDARFATGTTYPQLPFATASRFACSNSMPVDRSLQAPFAVDTHMMGNITGGNTGASLRWPPRSELQRFFGIKPSSQEKAATA
jgi:hypothetical protein